MTKKNILAIWAIMILGQVYFAQSIKFVDANLKKCLLGKEMRIDLNKNGEIEFNEAEIVINLDIRSKEINDISDIKYFKNIEKLICRDNKIDSLFIQGLGRLKIIDCSSNKLKYIKIDKLPKLTDLYGGKNQLSTLEINDCPNIKMMFLEENQLAKIDIKKLSLLWFLQIHENQLSQIDISNNLELKILKIDFNKLKEIDIRKNLKLEEINVDENVKKIMNEEQKKNSPFMSGPPPQEIGN